MLASKYQAVYRVDPGTPYKWKGPIYDDDNDDDDDDDNNNNNNNNVKHDGFYAKGLNKSLLS